MRFDARSLPDAEASLARLAAFADPCFAPLAGAGVDQEGAWVVYARTLDDAIGDDYGPCTSAEAISVLLELLSALERAHAQGFVHPGIVADTVLLETSLPGQVRPVLVGLGLPAPRRRSAADDVLDVAALAYRLYTGKPPWAQGVPRERPVPPISSLRADSLAPPWFETVLLRALGPVDRRFVSAAELLAATPGALGRARPALDEAADARPDARGRAPSGAGRADAAAADADDRRPQGRAARGAAEAAAPLAVAAHRAGRHRRRAAHRARSRRRHQRQDAARVADDDATARARATAAPTPVTPDREDAGPTVAVAATTAAPPAATTAPGGVMAATAQATAPHDELDAATPSADAAPAPDSAEPPALDASAPNAPDVAPDVAPSPPAPTAITSIAVTTEPDGAAVRAGSIELGTTPLAIPLEKMTFPLKVVISKRGFVDQTLTLVAPTPTLAVKLQARSYVRPQKHEDKPPPPTGIKTTR
ncbi:MAG: hypothetical protein U1F43_35075 [Myxococcota bacterium]